MDNESKAIVNDTATEKVGTENTDSVGRKDIEAEPEKAKSNIAEDKSSKSPNGDGKSNDQSENSPEKINAENAALSTGKISSDGGTSVFFTSAQVKAMTRAQVRENYARIIESMKCKTF